MKKSEKIIISLVVVVALYGTIDFMLSRAKQKETQAPPKVDISTITTQIASLPTSKNSNISKLSEDLHQSWVKNIFFRKHPDELKTEERKARKGEEMLEFAQITDSFIYSGYLEMDNARIAIINGLDYREGEMVDGFIIEKIKQKMVQLSRQGFLFNITANNIEEAVIALDQQQSLIKTKK